MGFLQSFQEQISQIVILLPVLLLSLSFHEFSHGLAAYKMGDPTAKLQGRLTLNPMAHLDPIGTLVLVLTRMFGWAKPVPINPRNFHKPRKGMMYVSLAGPGANFALAILFSFIWMLMQQVGLVTPFTSVQSITGIISLMIITGIQINIALGVFNLLPVPPLDGSKILRGLLPPKYDRFFRQLEGPMGMMLLFLLAFTGILRVIISPIINLVMTILI